MVQQTQDGLRLRARKDEHKTERRRAILDAALALWDEGGYESVTMAGVAGRAGITKGTIYLYFETKEHLFLAVLEELLGDWFDEVDARLGSGRAAWGTGRVAGALAESLASRHALTRLLPLLESVLERNVDVETARAFKQFLLDRVSATGARIEGRLAFLGPGEGARLLLHVRALLSGLRQMADPSPAVRQVIDEMPEMKVFDMDFAGEVRVGVAALVSGFESARPRRTRAPKVKE